MNARAAHARNPSPLVCAETSAPPLLQATATTSSDGSGSSAAGPQSAGMPSSIPCDQESMERAHAAWADMGSGSPRYPKARSMRFAIMRFAIMRFAISPFLRRGR